MPMSGPAYMHASIAIPELTANHHTENGWDHLRVVERPDTLWNVPDAQVGIHFHV